MAYFLIFYFICLSGFLIYSALLNSVVKRHCGINDPVKKWMRVYWFVSVLVIAATALFGLRLDWS